MGPVAEAQAAWAFHGVGRAEVATAVDGGRHGESRQVPPGKGHDLNDQFQTGVLFVCGNERRAVCWRAENATFVEFRKDPVEGLQEVLGKDVPRVVVFASRNVATHREEVRKAVHVEMSRRGVEIPEVPSTTGESGEVVKTILGSVAETLLLKDPKAPERPKTVSDRVRRSGVSVGKGAVENKVPVVDDVDQVEQQPAGNLIVVAQLTADPMQCKISLFQLPSGDDFDEVGAITIEARQSDSKPVSSVEEDHMGLQLAKAQGRSDRQAG
ncbi:hypothetical protein T484DRAFT_1861691 [Baffinella frigidus]|nr:hypothetical protein T484DRAFT_1861691 [Cryptophyta sp. CCMP2293]